MTAFLFPSKYSLGDPMIRALVPGLSAEKSPDNAGVEAEKLRRKSREETEELKNIMICRRKGESTRERESAHAKERKNEREREREKNENENENKKENGLCVCLFVRDQSDKKFTTHRGECDHLPQHPPLLQPLAHSHRD